MEHGNFSPEHINLLVTIDRKYTEPLITMLASYGEVHKDVSTDVYIAHSSLTAEDIQRIESETGQHGLRIHSIEITETWFKDTPVLERLPEESFYRLMAFHFLPEHVERCLYLDPDIYVRKSLLPLYSMDLGGCLIAAAGHLHGIGNSFNKTRLGIKEQAHYVNSGVMLMDIGAIRREFTLEKVMKSLDENIRRLLMGDQDMINILFAGRTLFIDERIYNLDERTYRHFSKDFDLACVERETAIIHYNGRYKPWLNGYKGVLDRFYPEIAEKGPAPKGRWKAQIVSIHNIIQPTKQQKIALAGVLLTVIACISLYIIFGRELINIVSDPVLFREWLNGFGVFDELVFILVRAAQTMIKFIPAEPLEIGAGYAWGAVPGMLYCVIGNLIGTIAILALTKRYGSRVIEFFLPVKNLKSLPLFQNSERIYLLLFILYLIPGSPKDGMTYLVGMMSVKAMPFILITGIARIPSVLTSTLCGSTLAEQQYGDSILIFAVMVVLAVLGGMVYRYMQSRKK